MGWMPNKIPLFRGDSSKDPVLAGLFYLYIPSTKEELLHTLLIKPGTVKDKVALEVGHLAGVVPGGGGNAGKGGGP